ncbi:hypothetical protein [Granulicella tundricola]|uniref:Uncharacterized protein n=1 Tax=Granulicella tundricola (strain ATCC BAA-1859 / DSM 23138 / MP5ACTX9) TaxID=1198114 RepID=E8WZG8_GRATM|nr:hypothetical protein [Granulicella tundricola]ADW68856.1 hypothetical protein AciX9_1808 [Granulicella tundricola MP5ACTX9]
MKMMVAGLVGWVRLDVVKDERVKVVDTAITVLGTMLVAVSFVIWKG